MAQRVALAVQLPLVLDGENGLLVALGARRCQRSVASGNLSLLAGGLWNPYGKVRTREGHLLPWALDRLRWYLLTLETGWNPVTPAAALPATGERPELEEPPEPPPDHATRRIYDQLREIMNAYQPRAED
ncbi:MAG: hypothetical protein AB7N76_21470 [Planctomycetota bacterium]